MTLPRPPSADFFFSVFTVVWLCAAEGPMSIPACPDWVFAVPRSMVPAVCFLSVFPRSTDDCLGWLRGCPEPRSIDALCCPVDAFDMSMLAEYVLSVLAGSLCSCGWGFTASNGSGL